MDKVIVYNADSMLIVVHPAADMFDSFSKTRELLRSHGVDFNNDSEVLDYIINKDVPEGLTYSVINKNDIPQDKYFRNAWQYDSNENTVSINIDLAKDIKLNEFRALREPRLAQLDVDFMRAIEQNNTDLQEQIIAKKQELRDVTSITLPSDLEELRNFVPDCLK